MVRRLIAYMARNNPLSGDFLQHMNLLLQLAVGDVPRIRSLAKANSRSSDSQLVFTLYVRLRTLCPKN